MNFTLSKSVLKPSAKLNITGSKSESNRLLLLQALHPSILVSNLSNSDDTQVMQKALSSNAETIDVHHAGTAMRFLTAYFSVQPNRTLILTGSKRMKERPIKILVEALRSLGADIEYMENDGYPPLKINGSDLRQKTVTLSAHVSSQYISALLLIAPSLPNGLEINLVGSITSVPYIQMTLSLLDVIGAKTEFKGQIIKIDPIGSSNKVKEIEYTVESDWSSASYYYSFLALASVGTQITLSSYKKSSLQGDSVLVDLYKNFGVNTSFENNAIVLTKKNNDLQPCIDFDLVNSPDIAQTIAVTCLGLGLDCKLSGLHTLKIKETDRLAALKTEIEKFGAKINITDNSLHLKASHNLKTNVSVATYEDHRMAMAFAPLSLRTSLCIENADVVGKSYPEFWKDLTSVGITLK